MNLFVILTEKDNQEFVSQDEARVLMPLLVQARKLYGLRILQLVRIHSQFRSRLGVILGHPQHIHSFESAASRA